MGENRYATVGWVSIGLAVLFPINMVLGIAQSVIGKTSIGRNVPIVGPVDLLSLLFMALMVYVLYMFRRLLNERYEFHGVNTLIMFAILWNVVFSLGATGLKGLGMIAGLEESGPLLIVFLVFFGAAMISGGLIDIFIASRLLQMKDRADDLLKAFTYVTLASGIMGVTVVLAPLAVILVPVWCVILGMIFLRQREEAQFV